MDKSNLSKYLDKYKDKSKKPKKFVGTGLKIVDYEASSTSYYSKKTTNKIELDDDAPDSRMDDAEEMPQIVAVIDERPNEIKLLEEFRQSSKWKTVESDSVESNSKNPTSSNQRRMRKSSSHSNSDVSPRRRRDRYSDSDASPPRKNDKRNKSPRRKYDHPDSDNSPPRKRDKRNNSTRRKYDHPDSENSPPRKHDKRNKSPPRRHDHPDSDNSPPRKHDKRNKSPPRKHDQRNKSPPRKHDERNKSPPRKHDHPDSDNSPPRKHDQRNKSPPRKHDKRNNSPRRNSKYSGYDRSPHRTRTRSSSHSNSDASPKRKDKTLEGKKAGLQTSGALRDELEIFKKTENERFQQMDDSVTGRFAKTKVRDKQTGRERDLIAENEEKMEENRKLAERKRQYDKWGKGIKQGEELQERVSAALHEISKPLARYKDDEDLDAHLRQVEREGDPMLKFLTKKKGNSNRSDPAKPKYNGPTPPPNRFNIPPGYRWDGVDRSIGYEKQWFDKANSRKALQEESYKWSVEDL